MKKIAMLIMMAVATFTTFAQLGAPKITVRDTFSVVKILYNEMALAPQDWPGDYIIEDPARINILGNVYVKEGVEKRDRVFCKHRNASEQIRMNVECNGKRDVLDKELFYGVDIYAVYVIGNYDIFVVSTKTRADFESSDSYLQLETPRQPEVNTNVLLKKSDKTSVQYGGSQGGDPNSNRYDGAPGRCGAGFSLTGRSAKALPCPTVNNNKEGKVVVKIWVDRSGNVTQVSAPGKGSTLTDAGYVQISKAAAMKAKFSAKEDAPEIQTGTITYVFRNN